MNSIPTHQLSHSRSARTLLFLLGLAFSLYLFFQPEVDSGFRFLYGDYFDTEIETAILEHWHHVFFGIQRWTETGYFFPYKGTLGYNDGYFIFGVIYSAFRSINVDPFVSTSLTHIVVKALGYVGMFLMLRRFRLSFAASLVGAILFTIAGNSNNQMAHGQLLSIAFAPIAVITMVNCRNALVLVDFLKLTLHGFLFAAVFGTWMLTAYYTAWFFAFFCTVLGAISFIYARRSEVTKAFFSTLSRAWKPILICGAMAIILLTPFFIVYLPKARETGMHEVGAAVAYALSPIDLFNVGNRNIAWSRFFNVLHEFVSPDIPADGEHVTGFPVILIILVVISGAYYKAEKTERFETNKFMFCVSLTVFFTWIAVVKFGSFSPWRILFFITPGAKGLRVISRYQIFLSIPIILIVMSYLDRLRARVPQVLVSLLALALIAESVYRPQPLSLDAAQQRATLAAIPPVPASCQSFFVITARAKPLVGDARTLALYPHNVDAMLLAAYFQVPTINGFSTFNPADWNFADSEKADYVLRVKTYVERHKLQQVCSLDATRSEKWNLHPF
ncbi:hypothetical protein EOS_02520 [Caballeronia mineralivorans PML1(12)]|uniref:Glycosyltransferase RgtA/B/C/D-like domain-containing protein n=1 Tax=Caballeronia mineralivorans PML1(12) TaxID=908627 RepID=A0A0J1D4X1_9BURK|nr:hypothetical protein [Caballeronia mineralivorans]KLU27754.1 hypothetical protein EOS_02520 [Caballeronia mineralivorans PML1(12)]